MLFTIIPQVTVLFQFIQENSTDPFGGAYVRETRTLRTLYRLR